MSDDVQRQLDAYVTPVAAQFLADCEVMARYASASGLAIPEWLGNALAKIGARASELCMRLADARSAGDAAAVRRLEDEIGAAVRFDLRGLTRIHSVLSQVVAPATPRSIAATACADTLRQALTSIPLLGQMLMVGLVCLLGFLFPWGLLADRGPWANAAAQAHLLFAAGLGAAFYAIFTANRYVIARTYDPKYTIVYWTRLGLGVIAGAILANIIAPQVQAGALRQVGPTTIALLGGYASDAVNRILRRLVDMLVTLVRGETRDLIVLAEQEMKAKLAEQAGRERLRTAASLLELYQRLAGGAPNEELRNRLKEVLDALLAAQSPTE